MESPDTHAIMSAPSAPLNQIALPPAVKGLLSRVRGRLRRDSMLAGLLFAVCCAVVLFWITTTLDVGWFRLQRIELPVGLRVIVLAVLLPTGLWLLASRVVFPLIRRVHDTDVALLLERRFPQFQDRLITSVESATGLPGEGPLVRPMLERSIREAERLAASVVAEDVFDAAGLKRLGWIAGGMMCSVAMLGIVQPRLLTRWWNAFVLCEATYHVRTTELTLQAIAQPGDRRIDFLPSGQQLTYRHPRGAALELEMTVPNGGPAEGQTWVIPDRVRVDVIRADGSLSRTYVSPSSERTFRFTVTGLQEPIEIELLAGDYRTKSPYRIDIVNSPGIDQVQLKCRYPEYTGWNQSRESTLTVTGSEVRLPVGTAFELAATSGKSLQAARIVSDQFEVAGDQASSRVARSDGLAVSESQGPSLISADGHTLTARFEIILAGDAASADSDVESGAADRFQATAALQIPSSTSLRFFLHDSDDVMSASPEILRVQGIEDSPPVVVAQMTGIGNAVTRLARLPIAGRIRDDYGLKSAGFEFLVDDESTWRPRPFRTGPPGGVMDFDLRRSEDEPFELFDLQPMDLTEGQTLTLSIVAGDSNEFPSPGATRSEPMLFRIVSNEELLSLLYTREIGLRGRFEEVIAQLEEVRNDLQFHQEVAARVDSAGAATAPEDRASLNTCATRSGNNLRRQTNELTSITEGFEEIVEQLINNAIPPQQLAENMRSDIVNPLKTIADEMMTTADKAVSAFRVAAQDGRESEALVAVSTERVSAVIESLNLILDSVRDMAEFHEALRDLKAIYDNQIQIQEGTKQLQKRDVLDRLKVLE